LPVGYRVARIEDKRPAATRAGADVTDLLIAVRLADA
jgi:hypothetical protein